MVVRSEPISTRKVLHRWRNAILKRQLEKNQESYLKALGEKGYTTLLAKKGYRLDEAISSINVLKDILQKENPALYEKIGAGKPNYEQIISHQTLQEVSIPHPRPNMS